LGPTPIPACWPWPRGPDAWRSTVVLGSRGAKPGGGPPGRQSLFEKLSRHEVQKSLCELSWQAKVAVAVIILTFVGFWRQYRILGHAPIGLKLRGLQNGDELKWAEDTFGVFLQKAVPTLEKANFDCHNFLNMLPEGQCSEWAAMFAEKGVYSFNLPHLQGEFTTRKEVQDSFCKDTGSQIKAIRLVWHFPDAERLSGVALFEVFTQASQSSRVEKVRWAQFAHLTTEGGGTHIKEFRLYVEAPDDGPLKDAVDSIVQANMRRLNNHDCSGFEAALPAGSENWVLQSLPLGSGKKDELDEKPRDQIIAKCRKDTEGDWKNIDLQYSSIKGIFPSMYDREVLIFFHKEKRYKGVIDVTDDPEALIVKLTKDMPPKVHTLYFFNIEGVHLVQEWGWKYGWASHHAR